MNIQRMNNVIECCEMINWKRALIHNDVVYEFDTNEQQWRFFLSADDYDYVEDTELVELLNKRLESK